MGVHRQRASASLTCSPCTLSLRPPRLTSRLRLPRSQYDLSGLWYKYQEEKKDKIAAGRAAAAASAPSPAAPVAMEV